MTTLTEGRLRITIIGAVSARKFDDDAIHHMSHCMKAVDFIIELDDRYVFIEFKDPQHPNAQERSRRQFTSKFQRGGLDDDLAYKYRDSFLYEWASGRAEKPIDYFVLVALDTLTSGDLMQRTDALRSKLPLRGPDGSPWPIARTCAVFNLDSWNRSFPEYSVSPIP